MKAIEFIGDDNSYQHWLSQNPDGFVINTYKSKSQQPSYISLHKATCKSISQYTKMAQPGGFTERNYIKICSNSVKELYKWADNQLGANNYFFRECSRCGVSSIIRENDLNEMKKEYEEEEIETYANFEEYNKILTRQIKKSQNLSKSQRDKKLSNSKKKPDKFTTKISTYKRNPDVIATVLERANGICEYCLSKAPFYRASDGSPYLEVHHEIPLSDGGYDTVENAVALCPNCHREEHFG